jgi:hypothetical protein
VNYLYAGLLALQYFSDFERDPAVFSRRYVALLKNGFNDEPALVANASALIQRRTDLLKALQTPRS